MWYKNITQKDMQDELVRLGFVLEYLESNMTFGVELTIWANLIGGEIVVLERDIEAKEYIYKRAEMYIPVDLTFSTKYHLLENVGLSVYMPHRIAAFDLTCSEIENPISYIMKLSARNKDWGGETLFANSIMDSKRSWEDKSKTALQRVLNCKDNLNVLFNMDVFGAMSNIDRM